MNTTLLILAGASVLGQSPAPTPILSDCLRACPPAHDPAPFLRTPHVEPVGPCQGAAACDGAKNAWKHSFHRAARFPLPRSGQCGEPADTDGLVIYEGMRLTVNPDTGVYDLTFTATAPPTPVTLRLQLEFSHPSIQEESVRLTLPPIEIEPGPTADPLRPKAATVRVNHRGYSELFTGVENQTRYTDVWQPQPADKLSPRYRIDNTWAVKRVGTARFGSALPNSDGLNR